MRKQDKSSIPPDKHTVNLWSKHFFSFIFVITIHFVHTTLLVFCSAALLNPPTLLCVVLWVAQRTLWYELPECPDWDLSAFPTTSFGSNLPSRLSKNQSGHSLDMAYNWFGLKGVGRRKFHIITCRLRIPPSCYDSVELSFRHQRYNKLQNMPVHVWNASSKWEHESSRSRTTTDVHGVHSCWCMNVFWCITQA